MEYRRVLLPAMFLLLICAVFSLEYQLVVAQTPEPTPEATAVIVDSIPSGSPLTLIWQTGGSPDEILFNPSPLDVDSHGNVYVGTEAEDNAVRIFDSDGTFVTAWGGGSGSGEGVFNGIQGFGFDPQGNIYIGDFENTRVQKFDSAGNFLMEWATEQPIGPTGLAVDLQGNVYVANHRTHDHYVQKFDSNGNLLAEWATTGSGDGQIGAGVGGATDGAVDLTLDPDGNVYVADYNNDRIEKYDSNGQFLASFGTPGFSGYGQFKHPSSVAVDGQGNIYVADDHFIQKLDPSGEFLAQWSILSGELDGQGQTTVDAQGNLHLFDGGQMTVDAQGNIYLFAYAEVYFSTTAPKVRILALKKFSQS